MLELMKTSSRPAVTTVYSDIVDLEKEPFIEKNLYIFIIIVVPQTKLIFNHRFKYYLLFDAFIFLFLTRTLLLVARYMCVQYCVQGLSVEYMVKNLSNILCTAMSGNG